MDKPKLKKENIKVLYGTRFLNLYDYQYKEGTHYFVASRRKAEDLPAPKEDAEHKKTIADAVSCFVILTSKDKEPRFMAFKEFRFPVGQYLLGIPAGLIDPEDKLTPCPAISAAKREIFEETALEIRDSDKIELVSPLLWCTPGMTDESNALVAAVVNLDDDSLLNRSHAEKSECFGEFVLLNKQEATEIIRKGRDSEGYFLPLVSWAGLMYFISDMWKQ